MRTLVVGALAAAGLVIIAPAAQAAEPGGCAPAAAHRGVHTSHAENTNGSINAAIEMGARFEIDLRSTSNDRIVLMHDATLARTTNGKGRVANNTRKQIRSYRTDDGQRVPVAANVLRKVSSHSARTILHLKSLSPKAQRTLHNLIVEYGVAKQVEVIGHPSQLVPFRRRNPGVQTYLLSGGLPSVDEAARYGGAHVFPGRITTRWLKAMRSRGVRFNTRIADSPDGWEKAQVGTTSVMTNDVAGYRAYCQART